jgi:hypothetical protein
MIVAFLEQHEIEYILAGIDLMRQSFIQNVNKKSKNIDGEFEKRKMMLKEINNQLDGLVNKLVSSIRVAHEVQTEELHKKPLDKGGGEETA